MNDLLNRLKFDIYERVNLEDKNEDIKVIEETELTPQIKMLLSKDEVKLVGNLLLKIKYIGDIPCQTNEFEHNIPVEITIPSGRVVDAWKLDVDIENFNIDLLGGRTVGVTGVMVVYEKESVKVDKVKLPKESAEAIELMRAKGAPNNEIVERHINKDYIRVNGYVNVQSLSTDTLIRALYIGYEVEQTPEDKVRELYENLRDGTEAFSPEMAIRETLDALNIKIDGINT